MGDAQWREAERRWRASPSDATLAEAIRVGNRILLLSPHPGEVKAEVSDVDRVSSEDGSAAALEREIHDLLFAQALSEHA